MRVILQDVDNNLPLNLTMFRNSSGLQESDAFLCDVLKLAIGNIESRVGISIMKKTWKVIHNNCYINLSNGPIQKIISIKDSKGKDISPLSQTRVHDNIMLRFEQELGFIYVTYLAGYDESNLPNCLKNTIEQEFWKLYFSNESKLNESCDSSISDFNYVYG